MFLMRFRPSVPICPLFSIFSAGDDDDDDLISDDHLKVTFLTVPRNKLPYTRLVDIVVTKMGLSVTSVRTLVSFDLIQFFLFGPPKLEFGLRHLRNHVWLCIETIEE
jgi:hypothetical protein